jgi:osmoprotectant transport system permease protein
MTTTGARTARRGTGSRLHKVGLTATAAGLASLLLLPYAYYAPSRIVTGVGWSALMALGPVWLASLAGLWLLLAVLSLGVVRGWAGALLRELAASALVVALSWGSGYAASQVALTIGGYSRLSIGPGVWIGLILCFMVVLSTRRELAGHAWAFWIVALLAPVAVVALAVNGVFADTGIAREYANYQDRYFAETANQMLMAGTAVVIATVIGVGLGITAFSDRRLQRPVFVAVNLLQTIPSLAAIVLLLPILAGISRAFPILRTVGIGGSGWAPVVIVLTMYALLAISVNTDAGLRAVPPAAVDAGTGMGMNAGQLMRRVRLPLASPVVLTGVRTSAVQTVGNATLAAFIGAGGLGVFIFQGMAQQAPDLILLGSLTLVLLAVVTDAVLRLAALILTPRSRGAARDGG